MNRLEFNRLLATVTTKSGGKSPAGHRRSRLDLAKVEAMPQADAEKLVRFLLRQHNRPPIVQELFQRSGLSHSVIGAFGYYYRVQGERFTFYCTAENRSMVRTPAQRRLHQARELELELA